MARRVYEMARDTYYSMDEAVSGHKNKQSAIKKIYFSTPQKSVSYYLSGANCPRQEHPYWLASAMLHQAIHLKLIEFGKQYSIEIPLTKAA